jgi:hypothetical protein
MKISKLDVVFSVEAVYLRHKMEGSLVKLMPYVIQNNIILFALLCEQNQAAKERGSAPIA